ncbi:hypothetical protein PAXINDRAFT_12276 [Paxillus involutus ATCC 200175]|uniref:RGS domain-containing protein n=1 Tax=Paxillus involutus ATCC 200175 TaxID=664439 RepID=A0A0C9TH27_PAXIN|nr:hypothetical protein PAXINDRAFT_12276 [Paxillus involutus ATCC 200175]
MAQPPASKLSFRGLFTLPYRLCNPPPAVGKVRSCSVTPVLHVRLDDVLARQHLPPIGLKDFEEYLLYAEQAPENLYFILWLKEYTSRYQTWAQRARKASLVHNQKHGDAPSSRRLNFRNPPAPDPSLALFYARAKQTFFTPNAEYELNIPSDILAPFHCLPQSSAFQSRNCAPAFAWHSQSAHPDPAVFTEVAIEVRIMLHESLCRFVRAAYTNVGSRRAACGIVAGCVCTLVAGVLPLVMTSGRWNIGPHGRLIRLVAFPGLWFGLTILIASLQGICLMVYIFGDLRQLRKFELARPAISRPMPMPISAPVVSRVPPVNGPSISISRNHQVEKDPEEALPTSPVTITSVSSFAAQSHPFSRTSEASSATSCESGESESCSSGDCNEIDVSPAFFDDVPAPEGPATASCLHRPEYRPSSVTFLPTVHPRPRNYPTISTGSIHAEPGAISRNTESAFRGEVEYGPSAVFIPPDFIGDSATTGTQRSRSGAESFDFDLLPTTRHTISLRRSNVRLNGDATATPAPSPGRTTIPLSTISNGSNHSAGISPSGGVGPVMGRVQYKCNNRLHPLSHSPDSGASVQNLHSMTPTPSQERSRPTSSFALLIPSFTSGVPAFASPFTQVRSPVVKRAQWEVVVRAGLLAAIGAGVITGVVVGVVP